MHENEIDTYSGTTLDCLNCVIILTKLIRMCNTVMTKMAGPTKLQIAPVSTDNQQLRKNLH